jgi:hypothetical protein
MHSRVEQELFGVELELFGELTSLSAAIASLLHFIGFVFPAPDIQFQKVISVVWITLIKQDCNVPNLLKK